MGSSLTGSIGEDVGGWKLVEDGGSEVVDEGVADAGMVEVG